jgi:hypothetical protein
MAVEARWQANGASGTTDRNRAAGSMGVSPLPSHTLIRSTFSFGDWRHRIAVEWEETVRRVRAGHCCRTGFVHGFEALAAGAKRDYLDVFLDPAKTRYDRRYERDEV